MIPELHRIDIAHLQVIDVHMYRAQSATLGTIGNRKPCSTGLPAYTDTLENSQSCLSQADTFKYEEILFWNEKLSLLPRCNCNQCDSKRAGLYYVRSPLKH